MFPVKTEAKKFGLILWNYLSRTLAAILGFLYQA